MMDRGLTPELHDALVRHMDRLVWSPLEENLKHELRDAQGQYEALLQSQSQFARALDRQRLKELHLHSPVSQFGLRMATISTFGLYHHRDEMTPQRMVAVSEIRRHSAGERERLASISLPPASAAAPVSSGSN